MNTSRAQNHLIANWVAIVLAVVSIIQGLAFNDLVIRFPHIYEDFRLTGDPKALVHFVLGFVLLLRIFQTYLTAALDYNPWTPKLYDVLIIFIIGAIEYHIFSSLTVPNFDAFRFHRRMSFISVLAIIGYLLALRRIQEELFPGYPDYRREHRLQVMNIVGVVVTLTTSLLIIANPGISSGSQTLLAGISTAMLSFNIYRSLANTFSPSSQSLPLEKSEGSEAQHGSGSEHKMEITITAVERADVTDLCQLLIHHFSYFFVALFDTSMRLTQRILKHILLANKGRHPFGYRAFYLAHEQNTDKTVGCLMLKTKESDSRVSFMLGAIRLAFVVLKHLGVVGLLRTIKNARILGPMIPSLAVDELQIIYLAVDPAARRRRVGSQLIEFAVRVAEDQNKDLISLEVREANHMAQPFFRTLGFTDEMLITSPGDEILDRGGRIRMVRTNQ